MSEGIGFFFGVCVCIKDRIMLSSLDSSVRI